VASTKAGALKLDGSTQEKTVISELDSPSPL